MRGSTVYILFIVFLPTLGGGGRHAGFWVGRENSLLQFACESQFSLSEHLNRNLVKETVC